MSDKFLMKLPRNPVGVFTPVNMVFHTSLTKKIPRCMNKTLMFRWSTDANKLVDVFPMAKTVFFNHVGDKFLYNNMIQSKFPAVEEIFLDSHPGECLVVHRFSQRPNFNLYITSGYYNRYLGKWWDKDTSYIKEISETDYNEVVACHLFEKPKYYP